LIGRSVEGNSTPSKVVNKGASASSLGFSTGTPVSAYTSSATSCTHNPKMPLRSKFGLKATPGIWGGWIISTWKFLQASSISIIQTIEEKPGCNHHSGYQTLKFLKSITIIEKTVYNGFKKGLS
jgi:hypothetical protein